VFRIVHKRQLSDTVFEMGVEAPKVAGKEGAFAMDRWLRERYVSP